MAKKRKFLPFIPTREILFYPQAVIPIIVGRDFSKIAIDESMENMKVILYYLYKKIQKMKKLRDMKI